MQRRRLGASIDGSDANQNVFDVSLRVFHKHVKVAILVKDSGVEQLEFRLFASAPAVFLDEPLIGESLLGIFVEHAHVAVRGGGIQIEVVLLNIFSVISLVAGQAEEPLFQDRVLAVPQRESEADHLVPIGNAGKSILSPAVGARARVIMREELPCGTVCAIVLADGSPLALRKVWPPALPVFCPGA